MLKGRAEKVTRSVEAGPSSVDRRRKSWTPCQLSRRSIAPFLTETRCGLKDFYRKPVRVSRCSAADDASTGR